MRSGLCLYKEASTTGTGTTIGSAPLPLHLLLGFVLMQINCQCPPKQYQETTGLFSSYHLVFLPLNKKAQNYWSEQITSMP
jgi:hypothetical protein